MLPAAKSLDTLVYFLIRTTAALLTGRNFKTYSNCVCQWPTLMALGLQLPGVPNRKGPSLHLQFST